jgi:hypothetical protein
MKLLTSLMIFLAASLAFAQIPAGGITGGGSGGSGVPVVRQTCTHTVTGSPTSNTCTNGSISVGDAIIITIAYQGSSTINVSSVVACSGDTPTQDSNSPQFHVGGLGFTAVYFVQSSAGGCSAVTATLSSGSNFNLTWINLSSGSTGRDASNGSSTGNNAAPSGGPITIGNANDIVVSVWASGSASGTITAPSGFTLIGDNASGPVYGVAYQIVSTTGTYTPAWTTANSINWAAMTLAYKG